MRKVIYHDFVFSFSPFRQYQDFLEDLEEDEALRKNVNIYRGEPNVASVQQKKKVTPRQMDPIYISSY